MSARKRHTAALDFMREFIASERLLSPFPYGPGWLAMVDKLMKRGWIERTRSGAHLSPGSWRLNMQRRNGLQSTRKGRRAVYAADRHSVPQLRPHGWDQCLHGRHMDSILQRQGYYDEQRRRLSRRISDLHGTRP